MKWVSVSFGYRGYAAVWSLAVFGMALSVSAMRIAMPLASNILNNDAVLIGTVTDDGQKGEQELMLDGRQPIKRWFQANTIKIDELLYVSTSVDEKPEAGESIEVITWAKEPPPPPNQTGNGIVMLAPVVADGPHFADPKQGQQYFFLLKKAKNGFYAQPVPEATLPINERTAEQVKEMTVIARVKNWSWGKPVNGLHVAVAPDPVLRLYMNGQANVPRGQLMFLAALRNSGSEPITVNLYGHDHFLGLRKGNEKIETIDLYENVNLQKEPFSAEKHTRTLQPGEIIPVARYGYAPYGDHLMLQTDPGEVKLSVTYESQRESEKETVIFWQGKIESKPATVKAVDPRQR